MTEQRMVPVELLELAEYAIRELAEEVRDLRNHAHAAYQPTCAELRAIIDGPGVEPVATTIESVASWIESQRNEIPATGAEFAAAIRSEFKFSPQPPATAQPSAVACHANKEK